MTGASTARIIEEVYEWSTRGGQVTYGVGTSKRDDRLPRHRPLPDDSRGGGLGCDWRAPLRRRRRGSVGRISPSPPPPRRRRSGALQEDAPAEARIVGRSRGTAHTGSSCGRGPTAAAARSSSSSWLAARSRSSVGIPRRARWRPTGAAPRGRQDREQMASAKRRGSRSTRRPVTPCRTVSGIPPSATPTTGVAQAIASSGARPNGSRSGA